MVRVGTEKAIRFPHHVMTRLVDPGRATALYHNTASDTVLSPADIGLLAYPGVHSIWAHGHGKIVSRAALTPMARNLFAGSNPLMAA